MINVYNNIELFVVIYKWQSRTHDIPLHRLPDELLNDHSDDAIKQFINASEV